MLEFLLAFEVGATMVVVPPTIYGGDELVDFLDAHAVSHAFITPGRTGRRRAASTPPSAHTRCRR